MHTSTTFLIENVVLGLQNTKFNWLKLSRWIVFHLNLFFYVNTMYFRKDITPVFCLSGELQTAEGSDRTKEDAFEFCCMVMHWQH